MECAGAFNIGFMNFKHKFGWTWTSPAGSAVQGGVHVSSSWSSFVPTCNLVLSFFFHILSYISIHFR